MSSAAFRMTSGHDFVAGAVLPKHVFHFRGSLAKNARFGSPDLQFSKKSRAKSSFWKSGSAVFVEVSHKTLLLELWILSFRGSLAERSFWKSGSSVFEEVSHAENARFGSPDLQFSKKSRAKSSFWKSGSAVFVEVSHKTLLLELWILSFRGSLAENARFGSPDLQFSRKSRRKRSFWKSGSSVLEEVSQKTFVLELRIFSFRGSLA